MNITKDTINIPALVAEIHAAEDAHRKGWENWKAFCRKRGIGRAVTWNPEGWYVPHDSYEVYVTGLYTLRACLRGKLHRLNPPAPIRDFNRSVQNGECYSTKLLEWGAEAWNRKLAEKMAERFLIKEAEATG